MPVKVDAAILETLGQSVWRPKPDFFLSEERGGTLKSDFDDSLTVQSHSDLSDSILYYFIGRNLDSIWHNEDAREWQLLTNIFFAVGLEVEEIGYFDTSNLHSEECLLASLDEIIDSGAEKVFSFDDQSELVEQLSEGLAVVSLPDLTTQLMSGKAKKHCYHLLISND